MEMERRFAEQGTNVSVRAAGEGQPPLIVARVAVFDKWSPLYGGSRWGWREKIAPGFFDRVLFHDVPALFNHDPNIVLGRTTAGDLKLSVSAEGLETETTPPDTQIVRELVLVPISRGTIKGSSFAFTIPEEDGDSWEVGPDGVMERTLLQCDRLWDVSPAVTQPWYPQTTAGLKERAQRALQRREAMPGMTELERLRIQASLLRLKA